MNEDFRQQLEILAKEALKRPSTLGSHRSSPYLSWTFLLVGVAAIISCIYWLLILYLENPIEQVAIVVTTIFFILGLLITPVGTRLRMELTKYRQSKDSE